MSDLEYAHGCGCDSDNLVHNHTDKPTGPFSAPSAMYPGQLHLPPYGNTTRPNTTQNTNSLSDSQNYLTATI